MRQPTLWHTNFYFSYIYIYIYILKFGVTTVFQNCAFPLTILKAKLTAVNLENNRSYIYDCRELMQTHYSIHELKNA